MKRKLIFLLVILFSTKVFAFDFENRISTGISLYFDNENINSSENYKFFLLDLSCEFLFSPFKYCNLSAETNFEINPFSNNYSISLNIKEYLNDDFSGPFIGFSPISKINFGNLFSGDKYLNYGLGFSFGFNKEINEKFNFETEGIISFCLFDKRNKMKVDLSTSVKYFLFKKNNSKAHFK